MPDAVIQRIGGSTFARLPPALVKELGLQDGETVQIHIMREGMTLADYVAYRKGHPIWFDPDWRKDRGASKVDG